MNNGSRILGELEQNILSLKHVILFYLFIYLVKRSWPKIISMFWKQRILKERYIEVAHTAQAHFHCWAECSDVGQGQETPPLLPLRPSLDFHFPLVDPVTICLLAVSSMWGEVMVTDPLFVLHMSPQQLPRLFFSYHSVLNQNLLLDCPLSSQISYTDWNLVSRNIHVLVTL